MNTSSKADTLAQEFLESLNTALRNGAVFPFSDDYRTRWNYVPITRRGVSLGQLSGSQREKAMKLLKASLSDVGYQKAEGIRELEHVLYELEGNNPGRDKLNYYFTFFGEPRNKGEWGWRYEGHHLSLNFTYRDDVLISSSPQFLGSNPANTGAAEQKRDGHATGNRVLALEQDLAFEFLNSLDESQRLKAVVSKTDPGEILTTNKRKVAILERTGIGYSDLKPAQQDLLMKLVKVYVDVQAAAEQVRRMERVEPKSLVFAWMGSTKPGSPHYYRVQGSKFLIEYDNSQNNANHIHSVWRDFDGDFGEDVLGQHLHSHKSE